MAEKMMIKGAYGTVYEDVEFVNETVVNCFGEEHDVYAPNLAVLTIRSYDEPVVGDTIMTSSSEFDVDAVRCCYSSSLGRDYFESEVVARFKEFDGSNYIPRKATNGGGYLHKYWTIEEVIYSEYVE